MKINRISPEKQEFLQILKNIAKPPEKLHFIGALPELRKPTVAIVGTRKPTAYGKEVFVVPGNITSPMSTGCNALLKQGATPITGADDVLAVIAPDLLQPQTSLALGNTPLEVAIIKLLASGVRDGNELQGKSGADPAEFTTTLTMLELAGTVRALGANQWTLS